MKNYIKHDEWKIIEEGFDPHVNKISESLFSIGNGRMGQRANFEETYTGETLKGSYVAGVYYPDKTRVGWWKNGYPEYFAKVLNAPDWIGIHVSIDGQALDLATGKCENFLRELDMRRGILNRSFSYTFPDGKKISVSSQRFCSMANGELGAISYSITPLNFSTKIELSIFVDADVVNKDSNYDEKFWQEVAREATDGRSIVVAQTRKTNFHVATATHYTLMSEGKSVVPELVRFDLREKFSGNTIVVAGIEGKKITVYKYAAVLSSENHPKSEILANSKRVLDGAVKNGYDALLRDHIAVWAHKWEECDITIEGDIAAQQGIRFNIFQLTQTYTGDDARLNIGPKGFTGEKYGGSTYWDTEAYCLPFYLGTSTPEVARNLLIYRHKQLGKAIENAAKLGFTNGAALYPMVTMNGEECHNEWEITFEEIHRNGAIAYAIYDYINYTQDESYLAEFGLDVLVGISRFWSQRVNWSEAKKAWVMLGVTGPNEYENNVNNNWYSNKIAVWTLDYTVKSLEKVSVKEPARYKEIVAALGLEGSEVEKWRDIIQKMYYPQDEKLGIFLQQDGFLDKEIIPVSGLRPEDRPLNQKWSWDRILRSCYIKQADVLQGLYFFESDFDLDVIRRNFDFYEPLTVHESSLSPCVHVILASMLGYKEKAYELYLRTARLDIDDYNNDTEDGCHITSMAGTWMSVTKGFGGMRIKNGNLHFNPYLPEQWKSYSFRLEFRNRVIKMKISSAGVETWLESGEPISIFVAGTKRDLR